MEREYQQSNRRSVPGMAMLAVFLALVFIVGPYFLPIQLPTASYLMLTGFGVFLLIVGMTVMTITRLYHRAAADEAFVRTGMGGPKIILDGGSLVVPVVHEVIWLSLRTMRFEVTRSGSDALLTGDSLRADITAEFFIRVPKERDAVLNAATSLGSAALNSQGIQQVLEKKLESAIRQVAAEMTLEELMRNRASFIERITEHVRPDIEKNGLALENVTISRLDQTPASELRNDNIFDAQGRRKIAEITNAQNVLTIGIELGAKQEIEAKTTETNKFIANQKVLQATAAANQERDVTIAQVTAEQEAAIAAAEQDKLAKVAGIERDKAVQLAEVHQAQTVEVASQDREKAVRTAEIGKEQATEVADRERQIAVAGAAKRQADAETKQLGAQVEREKKDQEVVTVQAVAAAEREKQQTVIAARAEAEKQQVTQEVQADATAYTLKKSAEGEKNAADLKADARRTLAQAEADARTLEAQGDQAIQMVPVEVSKKQVEVEQAKVDVERNRLSNQSEFESISKELQIALAQIEAGKEVQIAQANSMGVAFSAMKMTVWGDPSALSKMTSAFYRGQSLANLVNGFSANAPEAFTDGLGQLVSSVTAILKERGFPVTKDQVEAVVKEAQERAATGTVEKNTN